MATKIRLSRIGKRGDPSYRIVVADARKSRSGAIIEQLGTYNTISNPAVVKIDAEKAKKWIANGAQPTETMRTILKANGIIEAKNVIRPKTATPKKSEKKAKK